MVSVNKTNLNSTRTRPSNEWEEALLRSRRNLLVGSVGGAGALGALQVLNATEARADNLEYWPQDNAKGLSLCARRLN